MTSEAFQERLQLWEGAFEKIHGASLCYKKNVVKRTCTAVLEIDPEAPKDLVRTFARTRMFLRIRVLNVARRRKKAAEKADRARKEALKAAAKEQKQAERAAAKARKDAEREAAKLQKQKHVNQQRHPHDK